MPGKYLIISITFICFLSYVHQLAPFRTDEKGYTGCRDRDLCMQFLLKLVILLQLMTIRLEDSIIYLTIIGVSCVNKY